MNWLKPIPIRAGCLVLAGALVVSGALGDERQVGAVRDLAKASIETPSKNLLKQSGSRTSADGAVGGRTGAPASPKVEPGKVRWHRDFAAACAAAGKSRKPVLLFQLMGKLDDRFC